MSNRNASRLAEHASEETPPRENEEKPSTKDLASLLSAGMQDSFIQQERPEIYNKGGRVPNKVNGGNNEINKPEGEVAKEGNGNATIDTLEAKVMRRKAKLAGSQSVRNAEELLRKGIEKATGYRQPKEKKPKQPVEEVPVPEEKQESIVKEISTSENKENSSEGHRTNKERAQGIQEMLVFLNKYKKSLLKEKKEEKDDEKRDVIEGKLEGTDYRTKILNKARLWFLNPENENSKLEWKEAEKVRDEVREKMASFVENKIAKEPKEKPPVVKPTENKAPEQPKKINGEVPKVSKETPETKKVERVEKRAPETKTSNKKTDSSRPLKTQYERALERDTRIAKGEFRKKPYEGKPLSNGNVFSKESPLQTVEKMIENVKTFDQLIFVIENIEGIQGSQKWFSKNALLGRIYLVREREITPDYIPTTLGLRKKVEELLKMEGNTIYRPLGYSSAKETVNKPEVEEKVETQAETNWVSESAEENTDPIVVKTEAKKPEVSETKAEELVITPEIVVPETEVTKPKADELITAEIEVPEVEAPEITEVEEKPTKRIIIETSSAPIVAPKPKEKVLREKPEEAPVKKQEEEVPAVQAPVVAETSEPAPAITEKPQEIVPENPIAMEEIEKEEALLKSEIQKMYDGEIIRLEEKIAVSRTPYMKQIKLRTSNSHDQTRRGFLMKKLLGKSVKKPIIDTPEYERTKKEYEDSIQSLKDIFKNQQLNEMIMGRALVFTERIGTAGSNFGKKREGEVLTLSDTGRGFEIIKEIRKNLWQGILKKVLIDEKWLIISASEEGLPKKSIEMANKFTAQYKKIGKTLLLAFKDIVGAFRDIVSNRKNENV